MTTTKSGNQVGMAYGQAWLRGSDGFAYGVTGENTTGDTTMHAHLMRYMRSANVPEPSRVVTQLTGGNRWLGSVAFGINDVGTFNMILSNLDGVLNALAGGSLVDQTTNSRWSRFSNNENLADPPQMGLLFTALFQSREDGSDGTNYYVNYIIPNCQITPKFGPMSHQSEQDITYEVNPSMASGEPHGLPFGANLGLKDNKAVMYAIVTPKPLGLTTYIADGTETTFVLGYRPTSTVVASGSAANEMVLNGSVTALDSVVTSTGVATLASAGSDGDLVGVLYETDFQSIS